MKDKNIVYNIKIIDLGNKGDSIGELKNGQKVLLKDGIPGDIVTAKISKKNKSLFKGRIIKVSTPSPFRVNPKCQHFTLCGGCKLQNMDYNAQLKFKQKHIIDNLQRIAKIKFPKPDIIIPSKEEYFYRNKLEFSFSNKRWLTNYEIKSKSKINRDGIGFHKSYSWDKIIDINKCYLQQDPSNKIRNSIKNFSISNKLEFFDKKNKTGLLRTLTIRISNQKEIMILIQFYDENKNNREKLLNYIITEFPNISSLNYCINKKDNDTIYDQKIICYYGNNYITEKMNNLIFKITPKSFFQTNSNQALKLYNKIIDFAELKGKEIVYDLYSGTGTISQFVSKKCKKVIGIESVSESVNIARYNAKINNSKNTFFEVGDIKNVFNSYFINKHGLADIIITDPPRNGMHPKVIKQIIQLLPNKIIYVSCNSSTQARDISLLKSKYKITKIIAIDMFPQTNHIENIVLLEKE